MEQSARYKQSLLKVIDREWKALLSVIEQFSPEQLVTPDAGGWSPKDNLGHLTAWMQALLGYHFDGKPSAEVFGLPPELAENFDYNRVNAFLVEQNRNRPAEAILAELKTTYATVCARLEAMSLSDLLKQHFADDPEKRPLVLWVLGNTSEHFLEHRLTLEKLLK